VKRHSNTEVVGHFMMYALIARSDESVDGSILHDLPKNFGCSNIYALKLFRGRSDSSTRRREQGIAESASFNLRSSNI
jgi:hypothetical protein